MSIFKSWSKLFVLVLIVFAFAGVSSVSLGANRYEYIDISEGSEYYIDTQSIMYTNIANVIRFWTKKRVVNNLSERKDCIEINFQQNSYRLFESISYDTNGHVFESIPPVQNSWDGWLSIPPDSIIEVARDIVKRIIQNNTYRTPQQPFVTPQPMPQTRMPQHQLPMSTPQQQEEYRSLQEYITWLLSQPDYPEFDRWFTQKMIQAGVTPAQVNTGIQGYINLSNGRYSDIRAMLASWYREFYMERYGGQ